LATLEEVVMAMEGMEDLSVTFLEDMEGMEDLAVDFLEDMEDTVEDLAVTSLEGLEVLEALEDLGAMTTALALVAMGMEAMVVVAAHRAHLLLEDGLPTTTGMVGAILAITAASMNKAGCSTKRLHKAANTSTLACPVGLRGDRKPATTSLVVAETSSICSNGPRTIKRCRSRTNRSRPCVFSNGCNMILKSSVHIFGPS